MISDVLLFLLVVQVNRLGSKFVFYSVIKNVIKKSEIHDIEKIHYKSIRLEEHATMPVVFGNTLTPKLIKSG